MISLKAINKSNFNVLHFKCLKWYITPQDIHLRWVIIFSWFWKLANSGLKSSSKTRWLVVYNYFYKSFLRSWFISVVFFFIIEFNILKKYLRRKVPYNDPVIAMPRNYLNLENIQCWFKLFSSVLVSPVYGKWTLKYSFSYIFWLIYMRC